jgi:PilZ domain-containing protein
MDGYGPCVGVLSNRLWSDDAKSNRVLGVMDRRRNTRYDLRAQVKFSWKGRDGVRHREEGLTRDISERGVFVLTDFHPPFGTKVRFEVSYPSGSAQQLRIQGQGQVVRIDRADQPQKQSGFAAATKVIKLFGDELGGDKGRGPGPTRSGRKK